MVSLKRIAIPLFLNSDKGKEFSFNFRRRRKAFIKTDTTRFKIQTSDMGPPPPLPLAGPHIEVLLFLSPKYPVKVVKRVEIIIIMPTFQGTGPRHATSPRKTNSG